MRKYQGYHFPKVRNQNYPEQDLQIPNELQAQDSLFEISKTDEHLHPQKNFIKELFKKRTENKRYPHSSMSLPKKKEVEQPTLLAELKSFRQSIISKNINGTPINITNYFVIDERRHRKGRSSASPPKTERSSIQQQVNRKAKYLFRIRNRGKDFASEDSNYASFQHSFYLGKVSVGRSEESDLNNVL